MEHGATVVLVAHTADDQAETVLLNMLRGSGRSGLAGMAARRDGLARPLLGFRRAETAAISSSLGLGVLHDPMNDDDAFRTRSRCVAACSRCSKGSRVETSCRCSRARPSCCVTRQNSSTSSRAKPGQVPTARRREGSPRCPPCSPGERCVSGSGHPRRRARRWTASCASPPASTAPPSSPRGRTVRRSAGRLHVDQRS